MSAPLRWQEDPRGPEALKAILDEGGRLRPLSAGGRTRLWRGVLRRSRPVAPSPWWLVPVAAGFAVVAATVMVVAIRSFRPTRVAQAPAVAEVSQHVALGPVGDLEVAPGALLSLPQSVSAAGYTVALTSGRVCAHVAHRDVAHEGPFIVEAPQLRVVVVGTRFCVDAAADRTTVSVTEGTVRVARAGMAEVAVSAGGVFRSDAPPSPPSNVTPSLIAAPTNAVTPLPTLPRFAVEERKAAAGGCAALSAVAARADCYAGVSGGDDLEAQNALFALALLQRTDLHDGPAAVGSLHAYLARYPDGALVPEARQTLVAELVAEGRDAEAMREADRYLAAFGESGRGAEVALARANLLRLGKPVEAAAAYRELLSHAPPPAVRAAAERALQELTPATIP